MSTYQELLMNEYAKQYATNWFKMNEGSGTTLNDSKGNVVGTINGASWVDGGGLLFDNISNYVDFNSQVIPFGEKSIYFKFKSDEINPPQTAFLFSNINTNTSSKNGYVIGIFNGTPVVLFYQNSDSFSKWIGFSSQENVLTKGKIHEILVVCDSDLNFTFYIDDFTTPTRVNIPLGYTESKFDINGRLGRSNHNDTTYAQQFKGTIYDFKVWNQDITKLNINKTLILSNGEYKKFKTKELVYSDFDSIPKMTSNTTPSGEVIFSSQYKSLPRYAWKAFNNTNIDTDDAWLNDDGVEPRKGWLGYDFKTPKVIQKYSITSQNAVGEESTAVKRCPKDWTFEGSNNGVDWTVLDTKTGITDWTMNTPKEFEFLNETGYMMYRINITANNGDPYFVAIGEFEMFEASIAPSNWTTVSPTLPTSTQFLEQGMDDLSVFNRQVTELEPMQMEDKTNILFTNGEVGKVYQKSLDLQKYFDIIGIRVE